MKRIIPGMVMITCLYASGQNVGIGTSSPTGPLSFGNVLGNKIVLWGDGSTPHYGLGIQSGLLQLYTDLANSNIVFGYGRSGSFSERMRINNSGGDGMILNGRIHLKNGTSPVDINYGGGVWLYKADNSALLGFMGTQNNQNIGFYGGPAGWGFTYDAINSRVGIGNANPNAPLAFPPVLGKKITLYPGATGDVGFGVAGNRLQIYSDNPNADVAIGYDASGTFNERFSVKPNGALALVGNTGSAGQILQSNGSGAAASWSSPTSSLYANTVQYISNSGLSLTDAFPPVQIPDFSHSFSVSGNAKVLVQYNVGAYAPGCAFCGYTDVKAHFFLDNGQIMVFEDRVENGAWKMLSGSYLYSVGPGAHTVDIRVSTSGPAINISCTGNCIPKGNMIVQVISQ